MARLSQAVGDARLLPTVGGPSLATPSTPPGGRSIDDRLEALRSLAHAIDPSAGFRELVALLAEDARDIIGAASLSLSRWERDMGVMRVRVRVARPGSAVDGVPAADDVIPMADHPLAARRLAAGLPRIRRVDDPVGDEAERQWLDDHGHGSCAAIPVYVEGRLWGQLYVTTDRDAPPFTARDVETLATVADILGDALTYGEQLERMSRLAFEDPLTGLANRRAIDDRLDEILRSTDAQVAVVVLDVNGLKQVNDEFGHSIGDRALRSVADALSASTLALPGAICARMGGDEFCVVIPDDDGSAAGEMVTAAADQMRAAPAPQVTISAGAATSDQVGRTVHALFAAADTAQYRAKRTGRLLAFADIDDGNAEEPYDDERDRRHAPDADAIPVGVVCDTAVDVLDRWDGAHAFGVLETIADTVADAWNLNRWSFSRVEPDGTIRTEGLRVLRIRPAAHRANVVLPEDEVYLLDDYPLTRIAVEQQRAFWVHADRDDHDAAERAALNDGGMTAVIGIGGSDADGGWLLELFADEYSDDLQSLLPLAWLVARALRGRDTTHSGP